MDENKPVKDWTLEEAMKYCEGRACDTCIFSEAEECICMLSELPPAFWDRVFNK